MPIGPSSSVDSHIGDTKAGQSNTPGTQQPAISTDAVPSSQPVLNSLGCMQDALRPNGTVVMQ
jgi:hypothetical protein